MVSIVNCQLLIQVGEAQSAVSDGGVNGEHLVDGVGAGQIVQVVVRPMTCQHGLSY